MQQTFYLSWAISAFILLLLVAWVGYKAEFEALAKKHTISGVLIDVRERYSLNRLQLVMWTVLILSTFLGLLFSNLISDPSKALAIPSQLLGLMGISVASATVAGAVKDYKNATRPDKIAGGEGFLKTSKTRASVTSTTQETATGQAPSFVQVFLEEEGSLGENRVISVTKFQNFVFTLALGVIYVVLAVKAGGYPVLDEKVLWLIGISHTGYIGGKLPNKD